MSYTQSRKNSGGRSEGTALSLVSIGGRKEDFERLTNIQKAQPPRKIAALRAGGACDVVAR